MDVLGNPKPLIDSSISPLVLGYKNQLSLFAFYTVMVQKKSRRESEILQQSDPKVTPQKNQDRMHTTTDSKPKYPNPASFANSPDFSTYS